MSCKEFIKGVLLFKNESDTHGTEMFNVFLLMTLKGTSLRVVPSVQNIATLFPEFQLQSLNFEAVH